MRWLGRSTSMLAMRSSSLLGRRSPGRTMRSTDFSLLVFFFVSFLIFFPFFGASLCCSGSRSTAVFGAAYIILATSSAFPFQSQGSHHTGRLAIAHSYSAQDADRGRIRKTWKLEWPREPSRLGWTDGYPGLDILVVRNCLPADRKARVARSVGCLCAKRILSEVTASLLPALFLSLSLGGPGLISDAPVRTPQMQCGYVY